MRPTCPAEWMLNRPMRRRTSSVSAAIVQSVCSLGVPVASTPVCGALKRRLLAWYRKQARDLPWRQTRDAYRVVVSEFMLQQTQVSRVEQFYPKFSRATPPSPPWPKARPKAVRESWMGWATTRRAAICISWPRT